MTHVSTCTFQVLFRSVALVIKKLSAILEFLFHRTDFFQPCTLSYKLKKNCLQKSFKLLFIKVKKFHGDSVKNESARTKKLQRGGGRQTFPTMIFFQRPLLNIFFRFIKEFVTNSDFLIPISLQSDCVNLW